MAHHFVKARFAQFVLNQGSILNRKSASPLQLKPAKLGFQLVLLNKEYGGLAQLGERLPCKQEVSGSIPLISTNLEEARD